MYNVRRTLQQKTILAMFLALLTLLPALAQNGSAVATVETSAKQLVNQLESGLSIKWTGLGRVAGEMVDASFTNNSSSPMTIEIMPGLVLTDAGGGSQPIMLENHVTFSLAPGETMPLQGLRAYCLDHAKQPPPLGTGVDYQVVTDLAEYAPAVQQLWAGLRLDSEGKYQPVLKPLQHRTIVIQRSVWASLGAPNPSTQEKLNADLVDDARAAELPVSDDKVNWLAEKLWADVVKTMEAAPKE